MNDNPPNPQITPADFKSRAMTLRDFLAAATMTGYQMIRDDRTCPKDRLDNVEAWRAEARAEDAAYCYAMADAMLAERAKASQGEARRRLGGRKSNNYETNLELHLA